MASHIADFDNDGDLDIYMANDFTVPDRIFLNNGQRQFSEWRDSSLASPFFSMSIDSGDFNNDLRIDWLATGTTATVAELPSVLDGRTIEQMTMTEDSTKTCEQIKDQKFRENCKLVRATDHLVNFTDRVHLEVADCTALANPVTEQQCLLAVMWMIITQNKKVADCEGQFSEHASILKVCQLMRRRGEHYSRFQFAKDIQQVDEATLFMALPGGKLVHASQQQGIFDHPGGWTWSTKIADLDNDGWQDVFGGEGAIRKGMHGFNVFMHNEQKSGFRQKQFSWNLDDPFGLYSFTFLDYDQDGDLDIIGNSAIGPIQVYQNQLNRNKMLSIGFQQNKGNTELIGYHVILTSPNGQQQLREIKLGGGYQSFGSAETFFGLGDQGEEERYTVQLIDPKDRRVLFERELRYGHYLVELDKRLATSK